MKIFPSGLIVAVIALGVILDPTRTFAASFFNFSFNFSPPSPPKPPERPTIRVGFTPTPSPSLNPSPSIKPSPVTSPKVTISPKPSSSPKTTTTPVTTGSIKDYIMNQINEYRKSQGLSLVKTDSYTCNFAKIRAQEISESFNHDGFRSRINSKSLPYPSYKKVTENIAMNSNYQQAVSDGYKNVVSKWIASSSHAANMRADTPLVCVEAFGNYYAYEGWKP